MTRCDSLSNLYLWHIKYSIDMCLYPTFIVVIRFQICIFDILNTANKKAVTNLVSCDSLSNLYLWHIKYSSCQQKLFLTFVVIRFQICIFDILNTAHKNGYAKILCCDSLSNLYLWHIKYSRKDRRNVSTTVVIRFQICIFDILNTAHSPNLLIDVRLWFAFKFVSLTY